MRDFCSADQKLTGEQKELPLFVPIAMMFVWDVFVGEPCVVCGFSLKRLVTGRLSRFRNMDLEQLKWPQKKKSGWWLLPFSFMLRLSVLQVPHLTTTLSFSPL